MSDASVHLDVCVLLLYKIYNKDIRFKTKQVFKILHYHF